MAEPITAIQKKSDVEQISVVDRFDPQKFEGAVNSFVRFTDALDSSGLLPMVTSFLEHYDETLKIIVEQVSTEKTSQFFNNLLTIYTLLSSIDQKRLLSIINSVSETINSVDKFRSQDSLGLLAMLRLMKDPDVSAGLRAAFEMIGGLSRKE